MAITKRTNAARFFHTRPDCGSPASSRSISRPRTQRLPNRTRFGRQDPPDARRRRHPCCARQMVARDHSRDAGGGARGAAACAGRHSPICWPKTATRSCCSTACSLPPTIGRRQTPGTDRIFWRIAAHGWRTRGCWPRVGRLVAGNCSRAALSRRLRRARSDGTGGKGGGACPRAGKARGDRCLTAADRTPPAARTMDAHCYGNRGRFCYRPWCMAVQNQFGAPNATRSWAS